MALMVKLVFYGFPRRQIWAIMRSTRIGKWQESGEHYRGAQGAPLRTRRDSPVPRHRKTDHGRPHLAAWQNGALGHLPIARVQSSL